MPRFGHGLHHAAIRLLIAGTALACFSAQQLDGPVAFAQTEPSIDTAAFQPLAAHSPSTMNAAVSVGQFEELIKPMPVPTVAPTAAPTATPAPTPAPAPAPAAAKARVFETGVASTYGEGDGFEGNLTACGQVFRTAIVQVAHKSLPCGTMVRVEDTNTGASVVAEVTDRGPYIAGRIVDLSWGAFRQLDATGPGLLHVNVYLLDQ
jgi:rare lipoprotein A